MTTVQTTPPSQCDADHLKSGVNNNDPVSIMPIVGRDGGESNAPPDYQSEKGSSPQGEQAIPTQPVQPVSGQPFMIPAQDGDKTNKKEPLQFLQPDQPATQFVPAVQPGTINTAIVADNAISNDSVRMSYAQYITISSLKGSSDNTVPKELSSRGLTQEEFLTIITQVKQIKSKNDKNKISLWTGMIFMFGLIGYLLVSQRAVGNTKLRKKLESPLEEINRTLMNRSISVRFLWVDGNLRAYYK